MNVRAVVFDIYGTLLEVHAAPPDGEARWQALWMTELGRRAPSSLTLFHEQCRAQISLEHAAAKTAGVRFPEIYWPRIVQRVVPDLEREPTERLDRFLYGHAQIERTVTLWPGVERLLRTLQEAGMLLGLASNCQPYTLRELDHVLRPHQLSRELFDPSLQFLSFRNGFGKPDPYVFRLLTARCAARGIQPSETLMVGDRMDNDIEPARLQGWQAWHWGSRQTVPLLQWLQTALPNSSDEERGASSDRGLLDGR